MSVRYIGEPIEAVCVWAAAYGGERGQERIYAVSSSKPCVLLVIDPHRGVCLERWLLDGASHSWGVVATASGVYITGDGNLYRYVPELGVACLGTIISGEYYTWRMAADCDGNVYGGCYPGGKAFQYNPVTGQFRDYGAVVEGEQYVRCMKAWGGKLYMGIGTRRPYLIEMDTITGKKREIPLPPAAAEEQLVYDLDIVYPKVIIRLTPFNNLHVYDLEEQAWGDCIEGSSGLAVSPPDARGRIYFVKDGYLHSYHPDTRCLERTTVPLSEPAADFGWIERDDPLWPGATLICINRDGSFYMYHPDTEQMVTVDPKPAGLPVAIQSLAQGPDGSIYAGGYFAGGLAIYNPDTEHLRMFRQIGQIENMIAYQGKQYMGVYPKANIFCYDPSMPWDKGSNPELLFSLSPHRQDRPFAFTAAGDRLAIGTVPDYGRLGGALTLYDLKGGQYAVYPNVIDRQSIVSLAYRDGIIYAGSSIWGGLGIAPEQNEAVLMLWDVRQAAVLWQGVPITGEKAVSALTFDDNGMLWGLTAGSLFQFDPMKREVCRMIRLFPFDWGSIGHYWRGGYLRYRGDGKLIGSTLQKLFTYDIANDRLDILDSDALFLAEDGNGDIYFARDTKLYKYE